VSTPAPGSLPLFSHSRAAPTLLLVLGLSILWQIFSTTAEYVTSGTQAVVLPKTDWTSHQGTRLEYTDSSVRFSNTAVEGYGYLFSSPALPVPAGAIQGRVSLILRTDAGKQAVGILAGDRSRWIGHGVMNARSPGNYDVDIVFALPSWRQRDVLLVVSNAQAELGASSGSVEVDALSFRYARSLTWTRWVDALTGSLAY
jgi:hypothetical protein